MSSETLVKEGEGGLKTFSSMHYVYILKLSNGDYYTGETNDLKRRLEEHKLGESPTTNRFLPVKLVSYTAFPDKTKADRPLFPLQQIFLEVRT